MSQIAVALQTCDRSSYTARTLASFARMNDAARFVLLHGDDASEGHDNIHLARRYGFETVVQQTARVGMTASRLALVRAAASRAPWVLWLENDIDFVRPFPWDLFGFVSGIARVYTLRLYGKFKNVPGTDACLTTRKNCGPQKVAWSQLEGAPEPAEAGLIHWSGQPSVTRSEVLLDMLETGYDANALTARVKANVTSHFGHRRTAGRIK
jgi:hypothetical protein